MWRGDSTGTEWEGNLGRGTQAALTKAGLASCRLPAVDPLGSKGSPCKVNNLLTLSFPLVSQPKPSNQGVREKIGRAHV